MYCIMIVVLTVLTSTLMVRVFVELMTHGGLYIYMICNEIQYKVR